MRVLGVDDNVDILKLVQITVESLGHAFESAPGGVPGLDKIRNNQYDLVLLDLSMPDMTGLEVIDALVEDGIIKKQRVVLFTASYLGVEDLESKLREKGVHSILAKPVDLDQLMDRLQQIESEVEST
ncbi:MAG: response regulator [Thaumarchaeota archaeon]|nr:response regulator [Nitrososphaerota archaeon]